MSDTRAHFRLDGRVAVITGATGEIGSSTARLLSAQGASVVLGYQPVARTAAEALAGDLCQTGGGALAVAVDVRDADSVEALAAAADEFGRLDILIANAGIARRAETEVLPDQGWLEVLDINLGGVFRSFRAALPRMRVAGGGRLLATSSISGVHDGWPQHPHYTASKAGIAGLVKSVALEVAARGITVNAVAPGLIRSDQSLDVENSLGPAGVEAAAGTIPVGRIGTGADVAGLFAFLASEEASFITGQTFLVDGGASLGGYS